MDAIQQLGLYENKQLFDINAVWLHLQVITLSDIVDWGGGGHRNVDDAFNGRKLTDRYSKFQWPRQPVITTSQQNLWKSVLEAAFTSSCMILKASLANGLVL
jgi:hypothetical protein